MASSTHVGARPSHSGEFVRDGLDAFPFNAPNVTVYAPVLAAMAQLLKSDPQAKLRIAGHTDSTGSLETNKKLSLDRAQSVKERIVVLCACDAARIAVEGMGPDQPLESNDTPAGRALNRRVEITLGR